jgi:hypothetical protein
MPRKTVKIDMTEQQGEGAFVECTWPTVAEVLEYLEAGGSYEYGAKLVAAHVINWNLTDDAGAALAIPKGDASLVAKLTPREFRTVVDTLLGQGTATKN